MNTFNFSFYKLYMKKSAKYMVSLKSSTERLVDKFCVHYRVTLSSL